MTEELVMSSLDLDTIIKTYSEDSAATEAEKSEEKSEEKSMVSRLQASMIEEEELFPEKFADPYVFAEEVVSEAMASEAATEGLDADIELTASAGVLAEISSEIQGRLDFDESTTSNLEDQQLIEDIRNIPDRLAFKIGDVADIVDVKQYILRYWETEFEVLKPKKSRQNQRMYSRKDIENILLIKKLLYRDKFSIEGARRALKSLKAQVKETKQWDQVADRYEHALEQVKSLLGDIRNVKSLFN